MVNFNTWAPGGKFSSNWYIQVLPLSLLKHSHLPSTSALKFLIVLKLSCGVNTILEAFDKFIGGAFTVGGMVSINAWKLPNCLNLADSHPLCQVAFDTKVLLPAMFLMITLSRSS